MLPATPAHRFRLADVLADSLRAVTGEPGVLGLPTARTAIVVLIDGLGAIALRSRAGHARTLAERVNAGQTIGATFPTTTASGIATLTTGVSPGTHGLVGYTVFDRANDRVVNELTGWDERMQPEEWQTVPTIFERAAERGVSPFAIGPTRFRGSGFSRAVLRGAGYVDGQSLDERVDRALDIARRGAPAIVYLYVSELDSIAHRHGIESANWTDALETLDAGMARLAAGIGKRDVMLLTADHGALDVPQHAHLIVDPELLADIHQVAGEPRCLQLRVREGIDPADVARAWDEHYGDVAWVATRTEAIEGGLFGVVDPAIESRIGDVIVGARKRVAFYATEDDPGRGMIGQHGSLSADEMGVPLLRFGAAA